MVTSDLFAPSSSNPSTLCAEDSPVKTSRSRVVVGVLTASARDYGPNSRELWATFDRATRSWRTSALSLLADSPAFSETLPRSGMTRNGILYRLPPLARPIYATGVGLSHAMLPTPTATDYGTTNNGHRGDGTTYQTAGTPSLATMARRGLLPTPQAHDAKTPKTPEQRAAHIDRQRAMGRSAPGCSNLNEWAAGLLPTPRASEWKGVGPIGSKSHLHRLGRGYLDATMQAHSGRTGRLNPRFVEWMMGFPPGWTEVALPASETRSSRKSSK